MLAGISWRYSGLSSWYKIGLLVLSLYPHEIPAADKKNLEQTNLDTIKGIHIWRVSLQDPPYKSLHPSTTRDVLRCQPRIHP